MDDEVYECTRSMGESVVIFGTLFQDFKRGLIIKLLSELTPPTYQSIYIDLVVL